MLLSALVHNQAVATEDSSSVWITADVTDHLDTETFSAFRYHLDVQSRYFDISSGLYEYLVRPAVGVAFNSTTRAWLGYARHRVKGRNGFKRDENRYWQQLDWHGRDLETVGGDLWVRLRTEQRDISSSSDRRHVVRLMGRYQRLLHDEHLSTYLLEDWFVAAEAFADANETDWGGGTGLSQMRFHVGVGSHLNKQTRVEAGIMKQYFWVDGGENRANYIAMFTLRWHH